MPVIQTWIHSWFNFLKWLFSWLYWFSKVLDCSISYQFFNVIIIFIFLSIITLVLEFIISISKSLLSAAFWGPSAFLIWWYIFRFSFALLNYIKVLRSIFILVDEYSCLLTCILSVKYSLWQLLIFIVFINSYTFVSVDLSWFIKCFYKCLSLLIVINFNWVDSKGFKVFFWFCSRVSKRSVLFRYSLFLLLMSWLRISYLNVDLIDPYFLGISHYIWFSGWRFHINWWWS